MKRSASCEAAGGLLSERNGVQTVGVLQVTANWDLPYQLVNALRKQYREGRSQR